MRHSLRVRIRERGLDVGCQVARLRLGQRASREPLLERTAREILEHGERLAVHLALVEDPDDVGMGERDAGDLAGRAA